VANIASGRLKELTAVYDSPEAKQNVLDASVDQAISQGRKQLVEQITLMLRQNKGGGM
jgi:hypothetical protein